MTITTTMTKEQNNSEKKAIRATFEKIVVNAGVGRASGQQNFEEKILPQIVRDMAIMCGQKSQVRKARKSIAGFKVREGQIVGIRTTLRRAKLVDFFERLVKMVLPRVKDFSGIDRRNVDTNGNLNIGFKEQFVFPEINPEESLFNFPLGVNFVPRVRNREKAIALYESLGVPFQKQTANDKRPATRRKKRTKSS
jgi:large subunit ribosomal protein L5